MMKLRNLFLCCLLLPAITLAKVKLPSLITNGMVLQQQAHVAIWGWAEPGEKVSIKNSWDQKIVATTTDAKGHWTVKVKTPKAGGPYQLLVNGKNQIAIDNVLIGEVWLCSGQSNMEFPLQKKAAWRTGVFNYEAEIAKANHPQIRMFTVAQTIAQEPQDDVVGSWSSCNPETAGNFSAVAYYFAVTLTQKLNCPIGLIHASWGATPAESWVKKETLANDDELSLILSNYKKELKTYPQTLADYENALAKWKQQENTTGDAPKKPVEPALNFKSATKLYNGMIAPLIPYGISGVIWYQGEANTNRAAQYRKLFPALISSWRKDWKTDFPFYFVQIAMHYKQSPEIREAQLFTLKTVPKTGMAVISDVSDSLDIHPRNKAVPGMRLGLIALAKTYKQPITYSGPIYQSMTIKADTIILKFDHAEGLTTKDPGKLGPFVIADQSQQFVVAEAEIRNNQVWVYSKQLKNPVAVRFAWANYCRPNLYNGAGLPASPFRTDSWTNSPSTKQ